MNTSASMMCRAALVGSAALALNLLGCATGSIAKQATPAPAVGAMLRGQLHGGQMPVVGASIYLYAVGTTGYGSASTSLLTGATGNPADGDGNYYALTNSSGAFTITGDYACPTSASLVYLVAAGGDPGIGSANPKTYMMAALGNCQTLLNNAATTFVWVNEETTIAAAYALAPFATSGARIGAPSTNLVGITNAFAAAANLVNTTDGTSYQTTPSGNGSVPYALLNTLANDLAVCVNSNGAVTGGNTTPCDMLFAATTVNGVVPTDTFVAALAMAKNPSHNVSTLIMLPAASSPFQPRLTAANDLTMPIAYIGNGISTPQAVAIDSSGNAWIANGGNSITELAAGTGAALSGPTGYTSTTVSGITLDAPNAIAIDYTGNVWVTNCGKYCSGSTNPSNITLLTPIASSVPTGGGFALNVPSEPYGMAIDGQNGFAWVGSLTVNTVQGLRVNTVATPAPPASHAAVTGDYIGPASAIAIDTATTNEAIYILSPSYNAISLWPNTNSGLATNYYQGSGINFPVAVAVDSIHNLWVVNGVGNTISVINGGAPITGSPFSGGGLSSPNAIAMDGSGAAWVANGNGSLTQLSSSGAALSASTGYQPGATHANGIAIDGSGSVWVTDCGSACTGSGTSVGGVYQLIGAGTPVVTPLALAIKNKQIATAP